MSTDSTDLNAITIAFCRLVADGGHRVEEWVVGAGTHESEVDVIAYGDCELCLVEMQLRLGAKGAKPSAEAAAVCPSSVDGLDAEEDSDSDWA